MVYVMALNFILILVLVRCGHLIMDAVRMKVAAPSAMARMYVSLVPSLLLGLPLGHAFFAGGSYCTQFGNWSVDGWATLLGAGFGMLVFAHALWKERASASFWRRDVNVLGIVLAGYFGFVAVDHMVFFGWGHAKDAGMLNWGVLRSELGADDVQCNSPLMIVADTSQDEAVYRCPTRLALDRLSPQPFVPWPAYAEGKSKALARGLRALEADAERNTPRMPQQADQSRDQSRSQSAL